MSSEKGTKKSRSTKATKADLEAKIAELEAKLNAVTAQLASKPAEVKPAPAPQPKPQAKPAPEPKPAEVKPKQTLPAGYTSPKPEVKAPPPAPKAETTETKPQVAEIAPAYAKIGSEKYTGNLYYATRRRLAYHPPDKQFRGGQVAVTVQVSPQPAPSPEPEPQIAPEPEPAPKKEPRRVEPPVPWVVYTGENYYRTRQRLAYHPPDKQFREPVAVRFEEAPTTVTVEAAGTQAESQKAESKESRSRAEQLAEYEKEYVERVKLDKA